MKSPSFFAPAFYKIDLSEIPVLICTFYLGPVAGVAAELLKVMVKLLLKGTSTAFVGDLQTLRWAAPLFCRQASSITPSPANAQPSSACWPGTLVMTVFGSAFNAVYLLPKFAALYGMPMEAIIGMGTKINPAITSVSTLVLFRRSALQSA